MPDWFKEARLRPLVESSGKVIASLLPSRDKPAKPGEADTIIGGKPAKPAAESAAESEKPAEAAAPTPPAATKPKPPKPAPPAPPPEPRADAEDAADDAQGYGERERDALDQLIGSATASPEEGDAADNGDSDGR